MNEHLSVFSTAIGKHPKAVIVKNASTLTSLFLKVFDLRRIQFLSRTEDSYSDAEVELVEASVNEVAIKMIYKLKSVSDM